MQRGSRCNKDQDKFQHEKYRESAQFSMSSCPNTMTVCVIRSQARKVEEEQPNCMSFSRLLPSIPFEYHRKIAKNPTVCHSVIKGKVHRKKKEKKTYKCQFSPYTYLRTVKTDTFPFFSCPSSSMPTLVIHSLIHDIELHNLFRHL